MNLIEAMKSGKRFRRVGSVLWMENNSDLFWTTEAVLADDWEVEEEVFQLTEEELQRFMITANSTLHNLSAVNEWGYLYFPLSSADLKELGSEIMKLARDRNGNIGETVEEVDNV